MPFELTVTGVGLPEETSAGKQRVKLVEATDSCAAAPPETVRGALLSHRGRLASSSVCVDAPLALSSAAMPEELERELGGLSCDSEHSLRR